MAGKAIIPFNEALSTFALEREPSPVNLALAAMEVDQEAEHVTKTPLAIIPAPASKETPRGAKRGPAEPLVRPSPHGGPSPPVHRRTPPRGAGTRAQEVLHVR